MLLKLLCKAKTRREDKVCQAGINAGIATYIFLFNIVTTKHRALELPFKTLGAVSQKDF